jgi:hypothetical protein
MAYKTLKDTEVYIYTYNKIVKVKW